MLIEIAPTRNSTESVDISSSNKNISTDVNENLNSTPMTRNAADRRITKRRIIRAMYASFFLISRVILFSFR